MNKVFRFLSRLWAYLPVIWNDEDYDYGYILKVLQFKIGRTRKHLLKHSHVMNAEKYGKQMMICERLIENVLEGDYGGEDYERLEKKWGKIVSRPCEYGSELVHEKENDYNKEEIQADIRKMVLEANKREEENWNSLFDHLKRRMRRWWD